MFQEMPLFPALTDKMRRERNIKIQDSTTVIRAENFFYNPLQKSSISETDEESRNNLNSMVLRNPLNV